MTQVITLKHATFLAIELLCSYLKHNWVVEIEFNEEEIKMDCGNHYEKKKKKKTQRNYTKKIFMTQITTML